MFTQTFKRSLVLLFSIGLIYITGCNRPTPPTISCSTSALINAIQNANTNPDHDHIILPDNCDYELGELVYEVPDPDEHTDHEYSGLPSITSPITITGNGSRIFRSDIPGTAEFRIFDIGPTGSLALVELTLEGGSVKHYGGAVLIDGGTLTLNQCVLNDNFARDYGGAIATHEILTGYGATSEVAIVNSVFRNNSASAGGAIYQGTGSLDIDFESLFEHNEAFNGGAIHTKGKLTIYNSTFRDNTAGYFGGGIYIGAPRHVSLQGVLIENNVASVGGGIAGDASSLIIKDSQIRHNQASWGGGLYLSQFDVFIGQGTIIEGNTADEYGGGVLIDFGPTVVFEDCTIKNNQSGMFGGGIGHGLNIIGPVVSMTNCTVSGNSTSFLGGGIHINSGEWEIHNSTISGNAAAEGGGIFNGGLLKMYNSTISGNNAEEGGGVLHASQSVSHFSFVTVAENTAISGGGLEVVSSMMHVTNSLVALNTPQNCLGNIQPFGVNIEDDSSCGFNLNENLFLEPLGDYGGTTYTHSIPSFSPAAEVADPCFALNESSPMSTDQRGETRPQGAGCDLGAFEANIPVLPLPPIPSPCIYQAIKNSNCRESDHGEAPIVAILMKDETAELVALNPENTYGKFELPSAEQCWIALNLMSALDPAEECEVPEENPPEPELPEPLVCTSNMGKSACKERGGKWVEGATEAAHCSCP